LTVLIIGIWTALLATGTSAALLIRQNQLMRRPAIVKDQLITVSRRSLIVGMIAGCLGQFIFAQMLPANDAAPWLGKLAQIISLSAMGAMLGWGMSGFIPNLPRKPAALAGLAGGFLGGAVLIGLAAGGLEFGGRFLGAFILGFCIGLMVAIVEELAREASLLVHWGPRETSVLSLGAQPIVVGSDRNAHVFLSEFPPVAATVSFTGGQVSFENRKDNQKHTLRNGSKVQLGRVTLEVKTS
jgi:Ca-activated chloride channel family protein